MHSLNVQVPDKTLPLKLKGSSPYRNQKKTASFSNLINEASRRKDAAFRKENPAKTSEIKKDNVSAEKNSAAKETAPSKNAGKNIKASVKTRENALPETNQEKEKFTFSDIDLSYFETEPAALDEAVKVRFPAAENGDIALFEKSSFNAAVSRINSEALNTVPAEEIPVLDENDISFLKKTGKALTLDDIIENAVDYTEEKDPSLILQKAQEASVEEPELFLSHAVLAGENAEALSSLDNFDPESLSLSDDELSFDEGIKNQDASLNGKKVITVIDQRSPDEKVAALRESKAAKLETKHVKPGEAEITLTVNNGGSEGLKTNEVYSGSNVSRANFAKSIQESVPEFVKTGTILLKDNNHGTINMILKPENLGNVKLNLELSDKVITGHITVASKEAYDAFKDCIQNLKQAFEAGGYDSAEFTLSFDMSHQSGEFSQNSQAAEQMNRFFSEKTYSQYVSTSEAEPVSAVYYERDSGYRVSVVA